MKDIKLEQFINRLKLMGAELDISEQSVLGSLGIESHYLYINNNVENFERDLSKIRGTLIVLGGQCLKSTKNMFNRVCLTSLVIKLDTSQVKTMKNMFRDSIIENIRFTKFNTSNVEDMSGMFEYALIKDDMIKLINKLDTSKVKDMSRMFRGCTIDKLSIEHFKINKRTNMEETFKFCLIDELKLGLLDRNLMENTFKNSMIDTLILKNTGLTEKEVEKEIDGLFSLNSIRKIIV